MHCLVQLRCTTLLKKLKKYCIYAGDVVGPNKIILHYHLKF